MTTCLQTHSGTLQCPPHAMPCLDVTPPPCPNSWQVDGKRLTASRARSLASASPKSWTAASQPDNKLLTANSFRSKHSPDACSHNSQCTLPRGNRAQPLMPSHVLIGYLSIRESREGEKQSWVICSHLSSFPCSSSSSVQQISSDVNNR